MADIKKAKKVAIQDKPFHLEMPPVETGGCSILMVGSGRSGKTTALKYIIDRYFQKHVGAIFSESAKAEAYRHMKYPLLPLSCAYIPELIQDAYMINKETRNYYPFLFASA
jgi:GTPase SAR1 family protein